MNLQPAKKHESVTILMVPHDGYSAFPRAVDAVMRETRLPFELIIVEGASPNNIRHELEKRKERRKNVKIIYSNHRPRMAEAFNLGLPHIRTCRAFLMHNDVRVTPQWLENLIQHATGKPGVICPYMAEEQGEPLPKEGWEPTLHGFLVDKEVLAKLGEFDTKIAAPLLGVDLGQWLKKHHITVHKDPYTVLEDASQGKLNSFDMKLFHRQWDEKTIRESLVYVNKKWGLNLSESKYMGWLQKKKYPPLWPELPEHPAFPKISLKRFLQVLHRA